MTSMSREERQAKIASYGTAYELLVAALQEFPRKMWTFRPTDGWTIHEIVVHITDSEANSYTRCRKCIVEPGGQVMAYDESGWAKTLHYMDQSTDDALDLFRALRRTTYHLIKELPEATWANTIEHPENGTMTLDDWLNVYTSHVPDHIGQMRATFDEWQQKQ